MHAAAGGLEDVSGQPRETHPLVVWALHVCIAQAALQHRMAGKFQSFSKSSCAPTNTATGSCNQDGLET